MNMTVNELLERRNGAPIMLELGCGPRKRHADAIGIDALAYPGVDVVGDVYEVLAGVPDGSVDSVYSYHFVEHLDSVADLLAVLARIVKQNGTVEFVVPHSSNPYFYSDPTHKSFFGLYTFDYFSSSTPHRRKVPTYQQELFFCLEESRLKFKSPPPFYGRYAIKQAFGMIFNSCNYMRELHEEMFCHIFPCYEVQYKLRRVTA